MGSTASREAVAPWDGSTMPSQQSKIAIVTGANSGIGYFTARGLAENGAHVVLACRNEAKGRAAEKEMTAFLRDKLPECAGKVEFLQVDMGDFASVRRFADAIRARFERVDLLINNAGVAKPPHELTADGIEAHFGINHIGHFYLTTLLFDLVRQSRAARIVHIGSFSHRWKPLRPVNELAANDWWSWDRYGQSKLSQMLFMVELQRRLEAANITNVVTLASHPGVTYTGLNDKVVESIYPWYLQGINKAIGAMLPFQRADMGALPTLYAATHPDVCGMAYIGPSGTARWSGYPSPDALAPHAFDETVAKQLWALSEEITKTPFEVK